jgi:hypothetical protein
MTEIQKIRLLYLGADVFWFIGDILENISRPFNWAGNRLRDRADFLRFGEDA